MGIPSNITFCFGIQSVSPLHLLDIPMLTNSKFYDKYIEIEFPSLYGIGVRDHNVYDEDGNPQTSNDPTFVIIYFNEDGTVNESALNSNKTKWNQYGSGWASDYAGTYDAQAQKWGGGGTNNENASLFDFEGNPLPQQRCRDLQSQEMRF